MGNIRRQSVTGTIIIYIGALIGFVSTGLLLPKLFTTEQIGLVNILVAYAVIFAQFSSLGFNSATTRLFPYFRSKEKKHNGFLPLGLSINLVGFALGFSVFMAFSGFFTAQKADSSPLVVEYIYYVVPLFLCLMLFSFFDTYAKVLYNATIGLFLKEFVLRILVLADILLFVSGVIDFHQFILGYIISYAVPIILLVSYLIHTGNFSLKPVFGFMDKKLRQELFRVSLYGIFAGFMGVLTLNVDRIMVERLVNLGATGVYATCFFFGSVVALPARSITKISSAYLADAWKANDTKTISTIYSKSCITQLIVGGLIFAGLVVNLDNIFIILGDSFSQGRWVIVFIGFAYLIDMAAGVSANVLMTSTAYRYHTYILLFFLVLVVLSNVVFIPLYGIVGAALASMISKLIHDGIRVGFIYKKFHFFPFNRNNLITLLVMMGSIALASFIPVFENYLIDIFVRSSILVMIYVLAVYFLNLSEDINSRIDVYLRMAMKMLGRK